jgi:hypothetical protein
LPASHQFDKPVPAGLNNFAYGGKSTHQAPGKAHYTAVIGDQCHRVPVPLVEQERAISTPVCGHDRFEYCGDRFPQYFCVDLFKQKVWNNLKKIQTLPVCAYVCGKRRCLPVDLAGICIGVKA